MWSSDLLGDECWNFWCLLGTISLVLTVPFVVVCTGRGQGYFEDLGLAAEWAGLVTFSVLKG